MLMKTKNLKSVDRSMKLFRCSMLLSGHDVTEAEALLPLVFQHFPVKIFGALARNV